MIVAGIDEAGRGPVIGPMVMAICATDEKNIKVLEELGVKDSKLLTPEKRDFLFNKVKELCKYEIISLSPSEIDDALNDRSVNLNRLEGKTTAKLIDMMKTDRVIIDCPSTNVPAYKQYLASLIKSKAELVVEHKADLNNTIVGAASILAKVTRDREIERLQKIAKEDFGSGYPSDPRTISFLNRNWNKFDFFRKSWATYKKVADKNIGKQKGLGDY